MLSKKTTTSDDKKVSKYEKMTAERMKELLNRIIDHEAIGRNCKETIQHLLWLGFTDEELFNEFGFNLHDIEDAEDDMNEYEED